MNPQNEFTVLLVDDDDVACESVTRSFRKHNIPFPIVAAHDGLEALDILRGKHAEKSVTAPLIVLLDLNMPRMNGFEFLQEVRADRNLSSLVIFVLTTSNDDSDRTRAYSENIAGYMVKSMVGPQFSKLASLLMDYRLAVTLPTHRMASNG
ncbi:MAG: response regulator [Gammaproteobacteria bacterium]|nr:response regulator [Gammaproteobacteria bacterium]